MTGIPIETETTRETERAKVTRWRLEQLLDAGYEPRHAAMIAPLHDIDLHQAAELIKRGCSSETAARILL